MLLNKTDLQRLTNTAISAANKAAKAIQTFKTEELTIIKKEGGDNWATQIVTKADLLSQKIILQELDSSIKEYELGLLTEESDDNGSRFHKDYFWCIDPLDGTLPFTEGKDGCSISIALVSKAGTPIIGVISDFINNNIYHAIKDGGVYKNNKAWSSPPKSNKQLTWVMDRSFLKHPHFNELQSTIKSDLIEKDFQHLNIISYGGAAMNAIWTLENTPAMYFKLPKKANGGGSTWDYAATACIFNELHLPVSDIYGNHLLLNPKSTTFMNKTGILYLNETHLKNYITESYTTKTNQ